MASDSAFAVALLTLWHRVAEAGGAVGFVTPVERAEVGAAVAEVVDKLRSGRAVAFALTRVRDIVGFALLEPGVRAQSHTAQLTMVMVEPGGRRQGSGEMLMQAVLRLASSLGAEKVRAGIPAGAGLEEFFARFGFAEHGRSPGWIRMPPGEDRDEVMMICELGQPFSA